MILTPTKKHNQTLTQYTIFLNCELSIMIMASYKIRRIQQKNWYLWNRESEGVNEDGDKNVGA